MDVHPGGHPGACKADLGMYLIFRRQLTNAAGLN